MRTIKDEDHQLYQNLISAVKKAVAAARAVHYNQFYYHLDTTEGVNKIYRLASSWTLGKQSTSKMLTSKCCMTHLPSFCQGQWNNRRNP